MHAAREPPRQHHNRPQLLPSPLPPTHTELDMDLEAMDMEAELEAELLDGLAGEALTGTTCAAPPHPLAPTSALPPCHASLPRLPATPCR